jgi:hypothetical protein
MTIKPFVMKCIVQLCKISFVMVLFGMLLYGCRKGNKDEEPGNPGKPGDTTKVDLDVISSHLQFFNASKKQGAVPRGPASSSLKMSLKDTLYLFDEIKRPIKFLHRDTTKNVAGVFIQVSSVALGGLASDYYDVPEIPNMADSDTVSVIMIGVDPSGIDLPQTLDITIVPYDKNRQPLAESKKPVKINKPKKDPPGGNANSCGLVLPSGERWEWDLSIILGKGAEYDFYSEPNKVHSAGGQDIEGSCCNGDSKWPLFCVGEKKHNKKLHFATYYKISFENFIFFGGGNFSRQTMEDSPVPNPDKSNFCGNGAGKVIESLKHTKYEGNWNIVRAQLPPNPPVWLKGDSLSLNLLTTKSTDSTTTGYGNPGGIIHQLDCENGFLTLVQVDREGGGKHLIKSYYRRKTDESLWHDVN